jgi:hypothetical protein
MRERCASSHLLLAATIIAVVSKVASSVCKNNLAPADYKVIGLEQYGNHGKHEGAIFVSFYAVFWLFQRSNCRFDPSHCDEYLRLIVMTL